MSRRLAALAALALTLSACTPVPEPVPTATPAATAAPTAVPQTTAEPEPSATPDPDGIDVDLTSLSSTMVFAEVSAMVRSPEDYVGKTMRMEGPLMSYQANPALDIDYFYTVMIQDATACCQLGMEFVWDGGTLPEAGTRLRVTGTFEEYDCGGIPSHHVVAQSVEVLP